MRMILAGAALALLAACGEGTSEKAADNAAAAGNAALSDASANAADALADPARAGEVAECKQDVATELPAGTDLDAFCDCAVTGMQGGTGERQAMEACAAQMGINTEGT